ncbi:MAG: hypothetical protein E7633_10655 [Ruminococcaceae bacterium]|nr:hypothetical protein [Oscillospiraceae bacterium]
MAKRSLLTGVAYHGNRMPSHVKADMREISKADMDIVVHMFSHTDWDRHKKVMKDIFAITEDAGMEVWVDNWGLGGPPGDKSHFLAYYPDSHMYYSNGEMNPVCACLNSPDFRQFVKNWIETVADMGAKTIFWDEPAIPKKLAEGGNDKRYYACCCPRCKKLFEDRYSRPMPLFADADVETFRTNTIVDYFKEITEYSASMGLCNVVCVMLGDHFGIGLDTIDKICDLPTVHNIGSDPYWFATESHPYEFVYNGTKKNLDVCANYNKDHNIWIQAFDVPRGREEEIIVATEAAYDAGARTILAWGYMGSESNDYAAKNPERTWDFTVEAMKRIRSEERDRILAQNRKKYIY